MSFFKTMVIMGSGLALGCGGVSEREVAQEPGNSGSGSGGTNGNAGAGAGGTAMGSGAGGSGTGGSGTGTAGSFSIGGTGVGGSVGIAGAGGSVGIAGAGGGLVEPGPFDCPPQQWVCTDVPIACNWGADGFELPANCACDDTRPLSIADCAAGESFVCREGTSNTQGEPLTRVVPFECQCVPQQMYCGEACYTAFPYGDAGCSQEPPPDAPSIVLCDCAPIVLK